MNNLTKSELINYAKSLEKQIEDNKHLATAIEAKDREISSIIKNHDKELSDMISEKENELERYYKGELEIVTKQRDEAVKMLQRREQELTRLLVIFGNTLKSLQGSLDNAIELNEYFNQEVRK